MSDRITLVPGQLFLNGKYRLNKKLGEGGMSQVWAATQQHSTKLVALKVLHKQDRTTTGRFLQEIQCAAKLCHSNIVPMMDSGENEDGVMYMVMELLMGRTLRQFITAKPLELIPVLHTGIQIARAIDYMHNPSADEGRSPIWHRDMKPDNVMIGTHGRDKKGHAWLIDLGIAKFADPRARVFTTDNLPDVGTLLYMDPYQIEHPHEVDGRADIYGFGATLYESFTGHHFFLKDGEPATAAHILNGHLRAPVTPIYEYVPDCPEPFWEIIEQCLAKDPNQRPTACQIHDVLCDLLERRKSLPATPYAMALVKERRVEKHRAESFAHMLADDEAAEAFADMLDGDEADLSVAPTDPVGPERAASGRDGGTPGAVPQGYEERTTLPMSPSFVPPARVLPFSVPAPPAKPQYPAVPKTTQRMLPAAIPPSPCAQAQAVMSLPEALATKEATQEDPSGVRPLSAAVSPSSSSYPSSSLAQVSSMVVHASVANSQVPPRAPQRATPTAFQGVGAGLLIGVVMAGVAGVLALRSHPAPAVTAPPSLSSSPSAAVPAVATIEPVPVPIPSPSGVPPAGSVLPLASASEPVAALPPASASPPPPRASLAPRSLPNHGSPAPKPIPSNVPRRPQPIEPLVGDQDTSTPRGNSSRLFD